MNKFPKPYHNKSHRLYCGNCGKYGHVYRDCVEPITSLGIILFTIDGVSEKVIQKLFADLREESTQLVQLKVMPSKFVKKDVTELAIPLEDETDAQTFCKFQDRIKFLLIMRKDSLGYLEFVRGHYDEKNPDSIILLFKQMTKEEIKHVDRRRKEEDGFSKLWSDVWNTPAPKSGEPGVKHHYDGEYQQARDKFQGLIEAADYNLEFYINQIKPLYATPEWGFPKGRRNYHEENMTCAMREFKEETGLQASKYSILKKVKPLREDLTGTNGVPYRHIYYLAHANDCNSVMLDPNNLSQKHEIGGIGFHTYNDSMDLIRHYHESRRQLLCQIYIFIMSRLMKYYRKHSETESPKDSPKEPEVKDDKHDVAEVEDEPPIV